MDISAAVNRVIVPGRGVNHLRWNGARGHYEVYYLTFNHLPTRMGFWLRYTLEVPLHAEGACELWGHVFDARAPEQSFGLKERFSLSHLDRPAEGLVRIGNALLTATRATGALGEGARSLRWDLAFAASERAIFMAPYPLRALGLASTSMLVAHPDARFGGHVEIGGRALESPHQGTAGGAAYGRSIRLELDASPGTFAHLWGRKHTERWAWGHCNAFERRSDCSLDAVATWLKGLPVTSVFLRYRGRDYCLNAMPALFATRSQVRFPQWSFTGRAGGLKFVGTFRALQARMLQVTYEDPDGEKSYCANTEIADFTLEIWRGRHCVDVLVAEGTAHLEFGDRVPRLDVRSTV
jgi:hypothetical protein